MLQYLQEFLLFLLVQPLLMQTMVYLPRVWLHKYIRMPGQLPPIFWNKMLEILYHISMNTKSGISPNYFKNFWSLFTQQTFLAIIAFGKFQGVIIPATPIGILIVTISFVLVELGIVWIKYQFKTFKNTRMLTSFIHFSKCHSNISKRLRLHNFS